MASAINKTSGGRLGLMKPRAVGAIVMARRPDDREDHAQDGAHQGDDQGFTEHQSRAPASAASRPRAGCRFRAFVQRST